MQTYYFDLAGDVAANDQVGIPCETPEEAQNCARALAHRTGADRPDLAHRRVKIIVRDDHGIEIFETPIKPTVPMTG